jgi:hypothetical protein
MATLRIRTCLAAFLGPLLLASSAGAQATFVLPWAEPATNDKKVNAASFGDVGKPGAIKETRYPSNFVLPWALTPPPSNEPRPSGSGRPGTPGSLAKPVPAAEVIPVGGASKRDTEESEMSFLIQLTPPGPLRLFRFESEPTLRKRIRQEWKNIKNVEFPPTYEKPATSVQIPRIWPYLTATAEPSYVCYKRLWFEQKNSERYGHDLGVLQPVVSTGIFYTDLALMPLHWLTNPFRCYECNAGEFLPGDPVPLLWNPLLPK